MKRKRHSEKIGMELIGIKDLLPFIMKYLDFSSCLNLTSCCKLFLSYRPREIPLIFNIEKETDLLCLSSEIISMEIKPYYNIRNLRVDCWFLPKEYLSGGASVLLNRISALFPNLIALELYGIAERARLSIKNKKFRLLTCLKIYSANGIIGINSNQDIIDFELEKDLDHLSIYIQPGQRMKVNIGHHNIGRFYLNGLCKFSRGVVTRSINMNKNIKFLEMEKHNTHLCDCCL